MKLRFLGKNSTPDDSPTLYATDQDSYVVQGWIVTDAAILAQLTVPDDEAIVEVPAALLDHLALDGLDGEVTNIVPPIVGVAPGSNYIIQGKRVTRRWLFTHFSGDGHALDREMTTDPDVVDACAASFEEAWKIAIPHHEYTPS